MLLTVVILCCDSFVVCFITQIYCKGVRRCGHHSSSEILFEHRIERIWRILITLAAWHILHLSNPSNPMWNLLHSSLIVFEHRIERIERILITLAAWRILHPVNPSNPMLNLLHSSLIVFKHRIKRIFSLTTNDNHERLVLFVLFVVTFSYPHPSNPSNPMLNKKPCYPHGRQSLAKVKFSNETFSQSMMSVL